jgi:hypothetical protein
MSIPGRVIRQMTAASSTSILKVCAIWRDARWKHAQRNWATYAAGAVVRLRAFAPYALIELILPGGSVMALLLWLFRRRRNGTGFERMPARSGTRAPIKYTIDGHSRG